MFLDTVSGRTEIWGLTQTLHKQALYMSVIHAGR